jgi:hypothetical protein
MAPQVRLPTAPIPVEPGGHVVVEAVVRNLGPEHRCYRLEVLGTAESWASLDPPRLAVPAGGQEVVHLHLHPPRAPHVRSGETPVGLMVDCPEHGEHAVTEGVLDISRFGGLEVELFPAERQGRAGTFELVLSNRGNDVVRCTLAGRPDGEDLTISCTPDALAVFPGGEATSRVRVRSSRPWWPGSSATGSFRVLVRSPVQDPVGVSGALVPRPPAAPPGRGLGPRSRY